VYQPEALDGTLLHGPYRSADAYAAAVAQWSIRRADLVECEPGWQYAALMRLPALRIIYRERDATLACCYLAFASPGQCCWAFDGVVMGRNARA
jgi:hypothetical protein